MGIEIYSRFSSPIHGTSSRHAEQLLTLLSVYLLGHHHVLDYIFVGKKSRIVLDYTSVTKGHALKAATLVLPWALRYGLASLLPCVDTISTI